MPESHKIYGIFEDELVLYMGEEMVVTHLLHNLGVWLDESKAQEKAEEINIREDSYTDADMEDKRVEYYVREIKVNV